VSRRRKNNHFVEPLHPAEYEPFRIALRERTKEKLGSQKALMEAMDVTYPTIWRRNNEPDMWDIGQLRTLRKVLEIPKNELIEWLRPLL